MASVSRELAAESKLIAVFLQQYPLAERDRLAPNDTSYPREIDFSGVTDLR